MSGASLYDSRVSQILGEWVYFSPLAWAPWSTEVANLPLNQKGQIEGVSQYASLLFPAADFIGLLMDLNVPKSAFGHVSEYMTRHVAYGEPVGMGRNGMGRPSALGTSSWTHGRRWPNPLSWGHPCPLPTSL